VGQPHVRARISFRRIEDGGRCSPAFSGYRPMLNFQPWQSRYCDDLPPDRLRHVA
jgi:hypothetical protein